MKHLLKLASGDGKGYFEEVDQYTFNNSKFALADDGVSPRYEDGDFVIVDDDGSVTVHLACAAAQDLAVLVRGLNLPSAPVVGGKGCVRETPPFIKFQKGRVTSMLETKTGTVYSMNNKRAAPKEAA